MTSAHVLISYSYERKLSTTG